jgi:hypothetical protein
MWGCGLLRSGQIIWTAASATWRDASTAAWLTLKSDVCDSIVCCCEVSVVCAGGG